MSKNSTSSIQAVHSLSAMSEGHKEICRVFASGKFCKFGKRCRYLHFRHPSKPLSSEKNIQYGAVRSQSQHNSPPVSSSEKFLSDTTRNHNEAVSGKNLSLESASLRSSLDQSVDDHETQHLRKKLCSFFSRTGKCRYGDQCKFHHDISGTVPEEYAYSGRVQHGVKRSSKSKNEIIVCPYYMRGFCKYGSTCVYSHNPYDLEKPSGDVDQAPRVNTNIVTKPYKPTFQQAGVHIESAADDEVQKLRDTELTLLSKRYPKAIHVELEYGDSYQWTFNPTDPDWPYDVRSVEMKMVFPKDYPVKPMELTVEEDKALPNTLRRYIWKTAEEWINLRHRKLAEEEGKAELMFRPFLRWLDKNLEDLFTAGLKLYQKELMAKASGIELVSAEVLREEYRQDSSQSEEEDPQGDDDDDNEENEISAEDGGNEESDKENRHERDQVKSGQEVDPARRGTEIKFHNLQLKENAATLIATKVHVIVQCSRCKNRTEVATPAGRLNKLQCSKCSTEQYVTFRASVVHQFSSILGYLDLLECTAFDMILAETEFKAGCLSCDKDVAFGNLAPGVLKDTWCHNCHAKLRAAADSVRFMQLQNAPDIDTKGAHLVETSKVKKVPKDPAIQEGKPLPQNGTCKHYKKSFRWLRFPCCGKAYPCDVCHDDNEDHEMLFASRMICGFCAKEQPFAGDRPCRSCNSAMTKKFSEHWEGGKGCRDKVKMSRDDAKKYTNQSKTVSRKAQAKSNPSKKNTKLRHT